MLFVTVMDKEGRWWRILTLAVTFFISSVSTGMYYTHAFVEWYFCKDRRSHGQWWLSQWQPLGLCMFIQDVYWSRKSKNLLACPVV